MGATTTPADTLRRARLALLDGRELPAELRPAIRQSWLRSRLSSVPVDRVEVPQLPTDAGAQRLLAAAEPVLERFAAHLAGTQVATVLADRNARVAGRWGDRTPLRRLAAQYIDQGFVIGEEHAGTNGIGTALEEQAPVVVFGGEHYTEPLWQFVCVGVPIRHPLSRRIEGVLDLACPRDDANRLLLPTTMDLAAQIEDELSARSSGRERIVFDEFMARSRETSAPLVALSEHFMLTNAAAANLLDPRDQGVLWDQASESFGASAAALRRFTLSTGEEVLARCTPVRIGTIVAGALIEVVPAATRPPRMSPPQGRAKRVPALRERREDIPGLVRAALRRCGHANQRVGHQAMAALCGFDWPGDVRQLDEVVRLAAAAASPGMIGLAHLPQELRAELPLGRRRRLSRLEAVERDAIIAVLREHHGNKSRAAAALGLSRSTMYRKLRLFGLDSDRTLL